MPGPKADRRPSPERDGQGAPLALAKRHGVVRSVQESGILADPRREPSPRLNLAVAKYWSGHSQAKTHQDIPHLKL